MAPSLFRRLKKGVSKTSSTPTGSAETTASATAPSSAPVNGSSSTPSAAAPASVPQPITLASRSPYTCHTCRTPISGSEMHIHTNRPFSGDRRYHTKCFTCLHCHAPIEPSVQPFCFEKVEVENTTNNATNTAATTRYNSFNKTTRMEEFPFHRECFADHFGWKCVVCEQPLPVTPAETNPDGTKKEGSGSKFEFLKHPFFEKERMCPYHATPSNGAGNGTTTSNCNGNNDNNNNNNNNNKNKNTTNTSDDHIGQIRRCAGCHRFEPIFAPETKHFIDVGDSDTGRCVCLACCRTIVTTSADAQILWEKVVHFFEGPLGLISDIDSANGVSRKMMSDIPVLIVGSEALNDSLREYSSGVHYGSSQIMTRGLCLSEHCANSDESLGVTAILCLSGLPSDLTASILAHEATHAWMKLHPNFRYREPLPLKVEEGLCQLVAFLFLNDGLEDPVVVEEVHPEEVDESIPTDAKLRQYFKFCIETDESVYGEGFRLAARAYAAMGMQELLYYVALNHDFPPDC